MDPLGVGRMTDLFQGAPTFARRIMTFAGLVLIALLVVAMLPR